MVKATIGQRDRMSRKGPFSNQCKYISISSWRFYFSKMFVRSGVTCLHPAWQVFPAFFATDLTIAIIVQKRGNSAPIAYHMTTKPSKKNASRFVKKKQTHQILE